jgi:hypothetical protein
MRRLRLVLGIALIVVGIIFVVISLNPPEPTCGAQVMKPGDVCVVANRAVSYAERKAPYDRKARQALGVGVGVGVIGLLLVLTAVGRRRQRSEPVPPPAAE